MKTYEGAYGIKVTILADSINAAGNRFLTFELEYWRGILAELNTHRALSKNSFSSRAVPFEKMLKQLSGRPVRFGANQGGMQDRGSDHTELVRLWETDESGEPRDTLYMPCGAWDKAKESATEFAEAFQQAGYHKQVYNRLVEPFQMMKTVLSGTELSNFFWLRDDDAADPSLHELARVMRLAASESIPVLLEPGQWHLPYVDVTENSDGEQMFYIAEEHADGWQDYKLLTLEEAIKVSCARCAAVSYRNEGYGLEKSIELYDRLVGSDRKHASALEHCATPMKEWGYYPSTYGGDYQANHAFNPFTWENGITHVTRDGKLWSGNLCGWIQHRKLVPGENYDGTQ